MTQKISCCVFINVPEVTKINDFRERGMSCFTTSTTPGESSRASKSKSTDFYSAKEATCFVESSDSHEEVSPLQ